MNGLPLGSALALSPPSPISAERLRQAKRRILTAAGSDPVSLDISPDAEPGSQLERGQATTLCWIIANGTKLAQEKNGSADDKPGHLSSARSG